MFLNDIIEAGSQDRIINQTLPRMRRGNKMTLKGTTGTQNFSGQITGEDLNREWDDPFRAVCIVDVMRKSCVRTRQSMMLLKTPILGATMRIEPASDSPEDMKIAEFVEATLFDSNFFRWSDVIRQQMTYLDFGHSIMEKAYTRIDGMMILTALEFRKQQTILEWHTSNGILVTVTQANVFNASDRRARPMQSEQVVLTTYDQEGGNFGGFSALRPAWINWKAKMFLIKGDMVRYERFGIGTPMIENFKGDDIPQEAIDAVQKFRSNDEGFIAKTKSWGLSILGGGQNTGIDVHTMVLFHDHQILFNVMGNFMTKAEGTVGNFAVTKVGADMFFNNVEREANHLEDVWNKPSGRMSNIPQIVRENFGEGVPSPKLRIENLEIDDLDTFAERAAKYVTARLLDPTPDIRKHILERERLPLQDFRDNEQLDAMENIQPTLKKLSSGRRYVLQYTKSKDRILRLQGVKRTETTKEESQADRIVAAHLTAIAAPLAIKARSIIEKSDTKIAAEKACRTAKLPNSAALETSLSLGLEMQGSSDEFLKWVVDHFYEQIRASWTSEILSQFSSKDTDLTALAKVVSRFPTKEISGKLSGVIPVLAPDITEFPQGAEKKKKRRGRNVTPETTRLERKIVDMKGIQTFMDAADKVLEDIGQKHRDELSEFLVTRGAAILNSSTSIDQVVNKINAIKLDTEKLEQEVDRELAKVFRFGIDQVKSEVEKQAKVKGLLDVGRPVIEDQKEARKSLKASSRISILAFSQKLITNWKESVLNLYKRAEVSTEFIRDRLNGVSQKLFSTELRSLSSESFGVGRGVQMNRIKEKMDKIVHTEVLDENTCLTNCKVVTYKGLVQIKDITVGDLVWSGKAWRKVTDTMKRKYGGYLYSINSRITGTDNHPFKIGDKWKRMDELRIGDKLEQVSVKLKFSELINGIFRNPNNRPTRSFENLISFLVFLFIVPIVAINFKIDFFIYKRKVERIFSDSVFLLRRYFQSLKRFPYMFFEPTFKTETGTLSATNQRTKSMSFLSGINDSNCFLTSQALFDNGNRFTTDRTNPVPICIRFSDSKFFFAIRTLFSYCFGSTFRGTKFCLNTTSIPKRLFTFWTNVWFVAFRQSHAFVRTTNHFRNFFSGIYSFYRDAANGAVSFNFSHNQIHEIKRYKSSKDCYVYNLSVEHDHTYVANGYLVHNCQPCFDVDGLEFTSMNDPEFSKFRNGQNPECLGGNSCRGFNFIVMEGS